VSFFHLAEHHTSVFCYAMLSVSTLAQALAVGLIVDLMILHRWLAQHNLTTYEYILYLEDREAKRMIELSAQAIRDCHPSSILKKVSVNPTKDDVTPHDLRVESPTSRYPDSSLRYHQSLAASASLPTSTSTSARRPYGSSFCRAYLSSSRGVGGDVARVLKRRRRVQRRSCRRPGAKMTLRTSHQTRKSM
jgi:hypothetical protein